MWGAFAVWHIISTGLNILLEGSKAVAGKGEGGNGHDI